MEIATTPYGGLSEFTPKTREMFDENTRVLDRWGHPMYIGDIVRQRHRYRVVVDCEQGWYTDSSEGFLINTTYREFSSFEARYLANFVKEGMWNIVSMKRFLRSKEEKYGDSYRVFGRSVAVGMGVMNNMLTSITSNFQSLSLTVVTSDLVDTMDVPEKTIFEEIGIL